MYLAGLREKFLEGRTKRNLSCKVLADQLSAEFGQPITRSQLANFELGRTERPNVWAETGIRALVEKWAREDRSIAGEDKELYGDRVLYIAGHECPTCKTNVPGPIQGAVFCLKCGTRLRNRVCRGCRRDIADIEFVCCPYCGTKVD